MSLCWKCSNYIQDAAQANIKYKQDLMRKEKKRYFDPNEKFYTDPFVMMMVPEQPRVQEQCVAPPQSCVEYDFVYDLTTRNGQLSERH